jgi:hypothetical protein
VAKRHVTEQDVDGSTVEVNAGADITSGTVDNARFSAYSDLGAEGYLDNNADGDLLTRVQADARYGVANDVRFRAYRATSEQAVAASTPTKVRFNAETYDDGGDYDPVTNYRFVANDTMRLHVDAQILAYLQSGSWTVGDEVTISIYKNGAAVAVNSRHAVSTSQLYIRPGVSDSINLVLNDYVEIYVNSPRAIYVSYGASGSFFSAFREW